MELCYKHLMMHGFADFIILADPCRQIWRRSLLRGITSRYFTCLISFGKSIVFYCVLFTTLHIFHIYLCIISDWYLIPISNLVLWLRILNFIRLHNFFFYFINLLDTLHKLHIGSRIITDWFLSPYFNLVS